MKLKSFNIVLDIKKPQQQPYFEVVANDFETNILNIMLMDGSDEYSLEGLDVEIVFAKADGTVVVQDASVEDGIILCTLKTNTIAVPGRVRAEVRVLEGSRVLTSALFSFYVRLPLLSDDIIESSNEFPLLTKLIWRVDDLETEVSVAEEGREQQEGIREQQEGNRVLEEEERERQEGIRKANELDRIEAENERVLAEEDRESRYILVDDVTGDKCKYYLKLSDGQLVIACEEV